MNTKIIAVILVVLVLVVAGVYYSMNKPEPAAPAPDSDQQQSEADQPKFVFGVVKSVTEDSIVFDAVPNGDKTAKLDSGTGFTKQAKDAQGLVSIKPATLSDFKPGKQIFVYYESDPSDGIYTATKIHLIN